MVCQRCILTVKNILKELNIPFNKVELGEVELLSEADPDTIKMLEKELNKFGFELIETRVNKIVEDIKKSV